jgi:hypothetical protein
MADGQRDLSPTTYTIRIKGHLDRKWADWFYDLALVHEEDATTTLSGPLPDQTALHSVLDRIRDMNLSLISVCSSSAGSTRDEAGPKVPDCACPTEKGEEHAD